jgi:hypothetical protein
MWRGEALIFGPWLMCRLLRDKRAHDAQIVVVMVGIQDLLNVGLDKVRKGRTLCDDLILGRSSGPLDSLRGRDQCPAHVAGSRGLKSRSNKGMSCRDLSDAGYDQDTYICNHILFSCVCGSVRARGRTM